jgi:hypothetical protein
MASPANMVIIALVDCKGEGFSVKAGKHGQNEMPPAELIQSSSITSILLELEADQHYSYTLGRPFLENVVAVHDVGAKEMRFAQRIY